MAAAVSEVPDVTGQKMALGTGIDSLLAPAFNLQKRAAKRLDHSYSPILCRWINKLRRSDPVLPTEMPRGRGGVKACRIRGDLQELIPFSQQRNLPQCVVDQPPVRLRPRLLA